MSPALSLPFSRLISRNYNLVFSHIDLRLCAFSTFFISYGGVPLNHINIF